MSTQSNGQPLNNAHCSHTKSRLIALGVVCPVLLILP